MNGTNTNVRLQNLLNFTVKICHSETDAIVGTGIAVSTDGSVLTCKHVVEDAIKGTNQEISNAEISIYFPQTRGGEEKRRRATVEKSFPHHDDDIILLKLAKGTSPLAPEQIAILGYAHYSEGNQFLSYGFSEIEPYQSIRAGGIVLGSVPPPTGANLQVNPMQLQSRQIDAGMSGAGVLDTERNLIIGLVAERYFPGSPLKDDVSWAVDSKILTFDPFQFDLRVDPYPLQPAPSPKTDDQLRKQVVEVAEETVSQRSLKEKYSWNNAPTVLKEWTGRDHLLEQITTDWNDPKKHVTGLIGFGGEGKSSLARKWVSTLERSNVKTLDGLFWWGFYENRSVDEFLEAALKYMSGGRIDPRAVPSSNLKSQIIGAMLSTGKYLFVLDGLEVMQHQESDQYGLLQNNDLRDLLTFFARPDNQSFCLITSRAPLLDLMDYTTFTHRDVERLSEEDGRDLLRRLGVKGNDDELNKVVADWDGHALTLSILAAYLAEQYEGDIHHLADISVPTADEPRYERVHRVLQRYDEHLTQEEREFLKLFSVFRLPVQESAFEKVFEPLLKSLSKDEMGKLVTRLANYRLIRHDENENSYTTHPLIRNHYFALFTKNDPLQEKAAHIKIKDYYLSIAVDTPQYPTLDDLKFLIEVVHHACQAGAFDEAFQIYLQRIQNLPYAILAYQLGAYDTDLNLLYEFFDNSDISQDPRVNGSHDKRWIMNGIGFCLMNLGHLRQAAPFYSRHNILAVDAHDWNNASRGYQNTAGLYTYLGALDESVEAAEQAINFARREGNKSNERDSLRYQASASYLLGNLQIASEIFMNAEKIEQEIDSSKKYLYSLRGVRYADHLRRTGELDYARRVTEANLQICERNHWVDDTSLCHRALGDLDFDIGNHESAHEHYESTLKIARGISVRFVLIEALLARGRFFAKHLKNPDAAFSDLNEALGYCVESGYRIYEADVRVALAWAYLANGEKGKAKASAERALQMSNEMGYHWGKVDAHEVLEAIGG